MTVPSNGYLRFAPVTRRGEYSIYVMVLTLEQRVIHLFAQALNPEPEMQDLLIRVATAQAQEEIDALETRELETLWAREGM